MEVESLRNEQEFLQRKLAELRLDQQRMRAKTESSPSPPRTVLPGPREIIAQSFSERQQSQQSSIIRTRDVAAEIKKISEKI